MTQKTKNQHIVPQVHLRKFRIPNSTKLECFNAEAVRMENPQSPKSICSGYFHYAMESGIEDEYSQMVESTFGNLESWYGDNIERIEQDLVKRITISDQDRYAVSWVIANFYFRGQKFRDETLGAIKEVIQWMKGFKEQEYSDDELEHYVNKTAYATNRAFDKGFVDTLTHKRWRIMINSLYNYPFITGDEAVIDYVPDWANNTKVLKAFLVRTQLFHLSPRVAIEISFPSGETAHGKVTYEDVAEKPEEITKNNLMYVNHTYKYAYSPNRLFFDELIKNEGIKRR